MSVSRPRKNPIQFSTSSKITVSLTQIYTTSSKDPWLLSCNTHKTLLPKFKFFLSNGASTSDIVRMVRVYPSFMKLSLKNHETKFQFFISKGVSSSDIVPLLTANPRILDTSFEKRMIPLFELLRRFFKTSKDAIVYLIRHSTALAINPYHLMVANINLMTDVGVCDSHIVTLLQSSRPSIFASTDLIKSLEEVKGLGFNPSTTAFGVALMAKTCMSKKLWDQKVDVFKKWGWSDEDALQAFRKRPKCMLASIDKINLVMSFWVNHLGWDALAIAKTPHILSSSLEKTIIPRAAVVQFLLNKSLRRKNASLTSPFIMSEKLFRDTFIKGIKKESSYLLMLYEEKLNFAYTRDKTCMS